MSPPPQFGVKVWGRKLKTCNNKSATINKNSIYSIRRPLAGHQGFADTRLRKTYINGGKSLD